MQDFYPEKIYLDPTVKDLPVTQRLLAKFPHLPVVEVTDRKDIKTPQDHHRAKKQLYIARFQGAALKSCQGMGDYVCCQYYTFALVSDCHLECTYCILQDYLHNNPMITVYANIEEIFEQIERRLHHKPDHQFRLGCGELSDSLALDHITEFSSDIISFANRNPNAVVELKTKTANVNRVLQAEHKGNVVVSWSINPEEYVKNEELKCDTLEDRLKAARLCADKGYPVGFHFDPLLYYPDWESQYLTVVKKLSKMFQAHEIAWVSIGSLRFTPGLKKISQNRFPKSKIMTGELFPSADGKTRYFRPIREQMYKAVSDMLIKYLKKTPHYLCMETKAVWKSVYGEIPESNSALEASLTRNLKHRQAPDSGLGLLQFEV